MRTGDWHRRWESSGCPTNLAPAYSFDLIDQRSSESITTASRHRPDADPEYRQALNNAVL